MKEGIEIKIGDDLLIVPALSLKQVRLLRSKIETMTDGSFDADNMATVVEVVHAALTRNYPAITIDEVEDGLDMRNMAQAMNAVMAISGLEKKPGGQPPAVE